MATATDLDLDYATDIAQSNRLEAHKRGKDFLARCTESWTRAQKRAFRRATGEEYDSFDVVRQPGFSLKEAGRQLKSKYKLSEVVTETQLFALANSLIVDKMIGAYKRRPVIYRSLADLKTSTMLEGNYFTLQRGDIPVPVGENEEAPESAVGGILQRIRNYKFMRIFAYSVDLEQDDQTGQISDWATNAGDGMSYAEEQWWVIQLFNAYTTANLQSAGGIIPSMNIAGSAVSGYGGPTLTAGAPTQASVEGLYEAAPYVTDVLGNLALVRPDTILVQSGADEITLEKILRSMYNPSGAQSAGVIGGIMMKNVMEDRLKIAATPFVMRARAGLAGASTNPWGIGEAGKIGTFQDRDALEVKMEAPDAGKSFDSDSRRVRIKRRFGSGVRLPEFFLAGN